MSFNSLPILIRFICFSIAFVLPLAANAGELIRPDTASGFQWKSTECARPIAPLANSVESSEARLMRYARDIEIYIECIQREAQRDFQKAQIKMQEAVERDLARQTQIMNDMMLQAAKSMR